MFVILAECGRCAGEFECIYDLISTPDCAASYCDKTKCATARWTASILARRSPQCGVATNRGFALIHLSSSSKATTYTNAIALCDLSLNFMRSRRSAGSAVAVCGCSLFAFYALLNLAPRLKTARLFYLPISQKKPQTQPLLEV
jgi:hypothetical protein